MNVIYIKRKLYTFKIYREVLILCFFLFVGNTLEKALNKIGREDIVNKCIFNVELVTDDVEKAVARVRLDQPGFDSLKEELGPSRDTSLRRDATMDPKMDPDYEEPDRMKVRNFMQMYKIYILLEKHYSNSHTNVIGKKCYFITAHVIY